MPATVIPGSQAGGKADKKDKSSFNEEQLSYSPPGAKERKRKTKTKLASKMIESPKKGEPRSNRTEGTRLRVAGGREKSDQLHFSNMLGNRV